MTIDFSPEVESFIGCAASFLVILIILIYFEIKAWWEEHKRK